jgi:hypothetical protein
MSVGESDGPADPQEFSDTDDWQLAVALRDRRVGNPRCNKLDHGRSLDRQKRVRGIQMPDKNADGEFVDEILPSCSRTLPSITGLIKTPLAMMVAVRIDGAVQIHAFSSGCQQDGPGRQGLPRTPLVLR